MSREFIEFDWDKAKSLLAIIEEGSLLKGAQKLKLTQSTLSRQMNALEEELGVVLFEKIGRRLILTPIGEEFLCHIKSMESAARKISLRALASSLEGEGEVIISAPEAMASLVIPRILVKLKEVQPKIPVKIIATNDSSDLLKREADIAIRNYFPSEMGLFVKKLPETIFHLYATSDYCEKIHKPDSSIDYKKLQVINFMEDERVLHELTTRGLALTPNNFLYSTNNHVVMWEMIKKGIGAGLMERRIGDSEPLVQKMLKDEVAEIKLESWLVSHRDLKKNKSIRFVYDFMYDALRG